MWKTLAVDSILLLCSPCRCMAEEGSRQRALATSADDHAARFRTIHAFARGSGPEQLLWLVEDDGTILPGPFKGPMVFATDRAGHLWAGDTENGRICQFSRAGKNLQTIDLVAIGKKLGLPQIPALLDMILHADGRLVVADGANNAIFELSPGSATCRLLSPPPGHRAWMQINCIHCDHANRILVEDLALKATLVLGENAKTIASLTETCLAASRSMPRLVTMRAERGSPATWHILARDGLGDEWQEFAVILERTPIKWVGLLGFDAADNLYVAYETESHRHYRVFSKDAELIRSLRTECLNPGYDLLRPDWVGPDGTIYSARIEKDRLLLMQLE